jgi:luciferase-like monooxygenase/transmembrane protein TMEM174 (potassium channel)
VTLDSGRLEAFSDGVFAVAITLLALNLAVPGPGHGSLTRQLAGHWPSFAAYVVSFELGLGAGWLSSEYQQMGLSFDPARTRIARLEEAVQVITGLLAGQTVTFHGAHYAIDSLALRVTPAQRPRPPLMIGGGGPKMLAQPATPTSPGSCPRQSMATRTATIPPAAVRPHWKPSSPSLRPRPGSGSLPWN